MKRYLLSLAILVVGLFWVGVGAPVWGGDSLLQPSQPTPKAGPDPYDPVLVPYDAGRDAEVTKILGETKAISTMLSGRELGRDYWIRVSYVYEHREDPRNSGEKPLAMVDIFFDPPVSFSGDVPTHSDPCSGRYGTDERLEPNDPCLTAAKEYWNEHQTFSDVQWITAETDLRRGAVVEIFQNATPTYELPDIKGRYTQ